MNKHILAKIIAEGGDINSRKRLQKGIFLLQAAECNVDADYTLYLYGPYSADVADGTAMLVSEGLVAEKSNPHALGTRYSYQITEKGKREIERHEEHLPRAQIDKAAQAIVLFNKSNGADLWHLELAATIAYYRMRHKLDWAQAKEKAALYKQVSPNAPVLDIAERLALKFIT